MPFRTIVVTTHSKLEYSLNYLVYKTANETKRIFLSEISTILIQSTQVSITTSLLAEITKRKIKIIFCDEKNNPSSELVPYYNNIESSKRIFLQAKRSDEIKDKVRKEIVKEKIRTQSYYLNVKGCTEEALLLTEYVNDVNDGDSTNREAFAAKVYFNKVFYEGFSRHENNDLNASLNYGYTILMSQFSRDIVSDGYITQLGIHHKNTFNEFNLACDLMEPLRYIVDIYANSIRDNGLYFKDEMRNLLTSDLTISGKTMNISNAISIYVNSVFDALNKKDVSLIKFPDFYEL